MRPVCNARHGFGGGGHSHGGKCALHFLWYMVAFGRQDTETVDGCSKSGAKSLAVPPCFRGVLHSALGAPVTGRDRPALFRRDTPGPVQRSASAGSHQPPALFRGSCSVFFPSQSFAKIKDIVPALPGFVNPGFPGKFPSPAAKMLTKQPPALIIRKNTRRFPPLKRRRRSVI